jgi:hypothetical protein
MEFCICFGRVKYAMVENNITKSKLLENIRLNLEKATEIKQRGKTEFHLYYSGSGDINYGGWIVHLDKPSLDISDSCVHIDEVLDIIEESGFKGNVLITSDSCYSGQTCFLA